MPLPVDGDRTLIRGGQVADGSGSALTPRDLLIDAGRIAAVADPGTFAGATCPVIDASGTVVAPGFIDVHSHADNAPLLAEDDTTKILQGVTTEVVGNCGFSLAPARAGREELLIRLTGRIFPPLDIEWHDFGDLLSRLDGHGYVTNYAPLVGHGTLRLAVLGMADCAPDADEQKRMGALLDEALDAGAFGLSSGLIYPPGLFSRTTELVDLARHLGGGRIYATHMRGEGGHLLDSVEEALEIGSRSGCRVQISHLKSAGRPHWGGVGRALDRLARARADGVTVTQDVYPYDASSTMLTTCLPPWCQEGGDQTVLARLDDPATVRRLRTEIEGGPQEGWENQIAGAGYEGILVASTASHDFEGRTLPEIGADIGASPFDALIHVLRAERLRASMVIFSMTESDVEAVLTDPATMVGSDGLPPGVGGKPHPRLYGTFPRVLGRYVRERQVLDLPTAVAKMTSRPAQTFGLRDRGRIAQGAVADLVAFDPARVIDACDYRDPVRPPSGIEWVMQAGHVVVAKGRWLGNRSGRRLQPA
jgi:N-acyl-D-aspartate/D-glutamate deacylase